MYTVSYLPIEPELQGQSSKCVSVPSMCLAARCSIRVTAEFHQRKPPGDPGQNSPLWLGLGPSTPSLHCDSNSPHSIPSLIESGDSKGKWEKQPFLLSSHHPHLPPTQGATANRNGALHTQRKAAQECSDLIALDLPSTRLNWTMGRRIEERGLEILGRLDLKELEGERPRPQLDKIECQCPACVGHQTLRKGMYLSQAPTMC